MPSTYNGRDYWAKKGALYLERVQVYNGNT